MTTNEGKIYSNGLPLELFATMSGDKVLETSQNGILLLRRILTFPMVTVAAINGKRLIVIVMIIHSTFPDRPCICCRSIIIPCT